MIDIIDKLNKQLTESFSDYEGLYFFGSRMKKANSIIGDYDVVLIFGAIDMDKELKLAGEISQFEYENDVDIDYKTLTSSGKKSIDYIRKNVNPIFIEHAIDNGIHYGKR